MAQKLGVRSPLKVGGRYVPAMGLGSIAVSPLDMASAYATLAAGGIYSEPTAIRKVVLPNGKEDTEGGLGLAEAQAGDPRRRRVEGDPDPRGQRQLRHRRPGRLRPPRRGQDGDDRQARRRLVRRLHAGSRDGGLDGVPGGRDPDGERPRDRRLGRELPGRDLAADDGAARSGCAPVRDFPDPKAYPTYQPFQRGPLALTLRPVLRRAGDDRPTRPRRRPTPTHRRNRRRSRPPRKTADTQP